MRKNVIQTAMLNSTMTLLLVLVGMALAAQPPSQTTPAKALATADGEKPGSRIGDQPLKFGYDFAQQGTKDFANIGGVHLIDPVGKKKYLVVRDSQGNCDCSKGLKDLAIKQRVNVWARFPAPPDNVDKIVVVVPHFSPMDDTPLGR